MVTIKVDDAAGARLEALAKLTRRPVPWVVETLSYADMAVVLECHAARTLGEQPGEGTGGGS